MKKLFAIFLILACMLSLSACSISNFISKESDTKSTETETALQSEIESTPSTEVTSSTTPKTESSSKNQTSSKAKTDNNQKKILSPKSAVDIYMKHKNIWMENSEYEPMNGYGYCLLDLDFDGVLELISSRNEGSARFTYNKFYKINIQKQTVEEFKPKSEEKYDDDVDYYAMSHTSKLLKNKSTGVKFYLFQNYTRVSSEEGSITYSKSYFKNGKLCEDYLFSEYWHPDYANNTSEEIWEYSFNGKDVSKKEYNKKTKAFYKENPDQKLVWECIAGSEFDKADTITQQKMLLNAYRKFSYNGFSFDNLKTYDIEEEKSPSIQTMKYYKSDYQGSLDEYTPRLMLKNDGTFVLTENLLEGMGEYKGTYTVKYNHLILTIKSINFKGFLGDDLKSIDFTINNKNKLTLNTDLCASRKGDVFSIES